MFDSTSTYIVTVTTEDQSFILYKTMPTTPKTSKGIKSQNNKIERWAMKQHPNFKEITVELIK
ncbi:hypothetical protein Syn19_062 [Synechococcus phage Syn19]|uniref:Uncharacterized protein n=2 Tax=Pontusvirus syn19 TaxID=2734134 RepID=M4T0Z7_9CAUD|nr:hypothetical protein Syn19_062 [Synechococcus phage Syn19]ADO99495.1 hypothetical protein Syn19_062 [Synechococcus phage Syn19]AGH56474.1 hypothetical protein CPTG_00183 [Cyanophage Syn2]